jgi:hypothetical protein
MRGNAACFAYLQGEIKLSFADFVKRPAREGLASSTFQPTGRPSSRCSGNSSRSRRERGRR